ncbi:MAG: hypothetical protein J1E00_08335 [Oscillospiraceae bacterium]|nr:hypothetical protein [Oscillospiraceae bacterium]
MKGKNNERQDGSKQVSHLVTLLIAASLILANPVWCLTDILPDAVAWLLVWFALHGLAGLNDNLFAARKQALYLLAVETLKLILWIPLQSSLVSSDRMLAALVFSAGEAACMLFFFRAFLTGTEEISRTADCERVYLKIGDIRFLCTLFVLVRAACTVLPELTAIPELYVANVEVTDDGLWELLHQLASSEEVLIVVFSVLELIMAIVWLASFLPFLRLYRKEKNLNGYLSERFAPDGEENRTERVFSSLHAARICFAVGLVFTLDVQMNGVRVLPLCVFPAFFALGCVFLNRLTEDRRFRQPMVAALVASVLLLLAELYRHFLAVEDMMVFAEQSVGTELLSAGCILLCMIALFAFWLLFAGKLETVSELFGCNSAYFTGLPFCLLTLYALLQTAVFVLPLAAWYLNTARILFAAALWLSANRRLAALEEQIHEAVLTAESPEES